MADKTRWGIIGTGKIAGTFAKALELIYVVRRLPSLKQLREGVDFHGSNHLFQLPMACLTNQQQ